MKIYDCFTFYNELDLLELRLHELYNSVDHFVIVESNQTFTNNPKPFLFDENRARYQQWADKIIHVPVTNMPGHINPWVNEEFQRNAIVRGIVGADKEDIIVVSDADEIPRAAAVNYIKNSQQALFALRMPLFNFKFNYMRSTAGNYDVWAMAATADAFDDITPNALRNMRFSFMSLPYQYSNDGCEIVEHGGWHFGYLGDNQFLIDKAQNFSHQEVNRPDFIAQIDVDTAIANRTEWDLSSPNRYEIVQLDSYFPQELLINTEKYLPWILPNTELLALDILPDYPYNT